MIRELRLPLLYHFDKWEKINSDYLKLKNKLEDLVSIQDGLKAIKTAQNQRKTLLTISDFLDNRSKK